MSVLDTSAVLAVVFDEPGAEAAGRHIDGGSISVVNAAEVLGVLMRKRASKADVDPASLDDLDLSWCEPDAAQARRAAELSGVKDLSLGDRFCIALAEARGELLITADQDWRKVPIRVPVEYIR